MRDRLRALIVLYRLSAFRGGGQFAAFKARRTPSSRALSPRAQETLRVPEALCGTACAARECAVRC